MTRTGTKTRILDAAEQLFARNGFHNTSLREVTGLAEANLAAVNYHFGSKDGLLQAVIERRLLPLNEIRQQSLSTVVSLAETSGRRPEVRKLMQAFIEPTLAFRNSGPGASDFIALIGRSLSEPDETVHKCFLDQVLPLFKQLFQSLSLALPELPAEILLARLQFTLGAMSHVMCSGVRPVVKMPGFPEPLSDDKLVDELVAFVSQGLEGAC